MAAQRVIITLECTDLSASATTRTTKNKRANAEKLELSKFCRVAASTPNHKETK